MAAILQMTFLNMLNECFVISLKCGPQGPVDNK